MGHNGMSRVFSAVWYRMKKKQGRTCCLTADKIQCISVLNGVVSVSSNKIYPDENTAT